MLEAASEAGHELWVSTISVSEIFLGAYLQRDPESGFVRARKALAQFRWHDFDGDAALRTGQVLAFLMAHGRRIEYEDAAIAGAFLAAGGDVIVTDNKAHFESVPGLSGRVRTPKEATKELGGRT
jgi:tRNA(fMet)-specific endonuclease VapC